MFSIRSSLGALLTEDIVWFRNVGDLQIQRQQFSVSFVHEVDVKDEKINPGCYTPYVVSRTVDVKEADLEEGYRMEESENIAKELGPKNTDSYEGEATTVAAELERLNLTENKCAEMEQNMPEKTPDHLSVAASMQGDVVDENMNVNNLASDKISEKVGVKKAIPKKPPRCIMKQSDKRVIQK